MRYRIDGVAKMIGLGSYPEVSLKIAREKAVEIKKSIENGIDPSMLHKATKKAVVFKDIAKEWFDRFSETTTERYAKEIWSRLEREVFPYIGNMALTEIDPPMVLSVLRRVEDRGTL